MHVAVRVDGALNAVDPSEADRFLDGFVVRQRRSTRVAVVEDQPDFVLRCVVLARPRSPRLPRSRCNTQRPAPLIRSIRSDAYWQLCRPIDLIGQFISFILLKK